ncbi:MAG: GGDEF domain-containing protein [Clostridia bacterium]|nr:GGDEF domain-containing protein [Clostridia bacterium]
MSEIASFVDMYIISNVFLLIFSGYIFLRITPDTMKALEYRCFKLLIVVFQIYLLLETFRTLREFDLVIIPDEAFSAVCFCSLLFAIINAFAFYMLMIVHLDRGFKSNIRALILGLIPFLTALVMLSVSLFNGAVFSLDANGHMIKGKLYILVLALAFVYLFVIGRMYLHTAKNTRSNISAKREAATAVLVCLFLTGWAIFDDRFSNTTVLPLAIFGVILHTFISYQQANIYTDTLTGMNNRRRAEVYLGNEISNNSSDMPFYLFMGDINGFKGINDSYGHAEGDRALIIFAEAVKKSATAYNGFAARYGGDEFVWGWRPVKGGDFDPEMVINDIRHRVAAECVSEKRPYVLSLAVGYIVCDDPKHSVTAYLKEADRKMYDDKQGHYRANRK